MSNYRSFTIWPSNISDPEGINKLIRLSQVKFADLYSEMINIIKSALSEEDWDDFFNDFKEIAWDKILESFPEYTVPRPFYHRKLRNESKQMFDHLAKIREDIYKSFPKTKKELYYESKEFMEDQLRTAKYTDILERRLNEPHSQDTSTHRRQKRKNKRTRSSRRRKIVKIPYEPIRVYNHEKGRVEKIMIPDLTNI
jgi:hypothetical protein